MTYHQALDWLVCVYVYCLLNIKSVYFPVRKYILFICDLLKSIRSFKPFWIIAEWRLPFLFASARIASHSGLIIAVKCIYLIGYIAFLYFEKKYLLEKSSDDESSLLDISCRSMADHSQLIFALRSLLRLDMPESSVVSLECVC